MLKTTNMATVQNFSIVSNNYHVVGIYTSANKVEELLVLNFSCNFIHKERL